MRRTTANAVLLLAALLLAGCGGKPSETVAPPNQPTSPDAELLSDPEPDDGGYGALVQAPGSELVVMHCVRCHGPRQFLQQRGSRDTWRGLIRWMQKDHGMLPLDEQVEDRIVEYLATHYAPVDKGRRPPLAPELMPPNPYVR